MSILLDIAKEIAKFSAGKAAQRLSRDHRIVKILKNTPFFELKNDFGSIYAHALVEYGIDGKSEKLLHLFADDAVKELFREKLYAATLDETSAMADILHSIQHLGKEKLFLSKGELKKEVSAFKKKFSEMVNKARNPGELEMFNKIKFLEWRELERSYEYQIERYLQTLKDDFYKEFLKNKYYVDLNGEIRRPKKIELELRQKAFEELEKEKRYEITEFKPLDSYINQWLANDRSHFLVIMGEYGTGKTTFMRHLAHQLAAQRVGANDYNLTIIDYQQRVPIFLPLRDFERTTEVFIVSQMNINGITDVDYIRFKKRLKNGELILLLDGFDEMSQRIDADEKARNFALIRQLIEIGGGAKIILTCREEFFRSNEEMEQIFGHQDRSNYDMVYLQPFSDEQIKQFLETHTDEADFYWEKIKEIFDLHDLAKRPVLLEFIVKYLPQLIEQKKPHQPIRAADLYQTCIDDELRRKEKLTQALAGKYRLPLLQKLAVWMFLNDTLIYDVVLQEEELQLRAFFNVESPWEFERKLNEFLAFTFLIRERENRFRISHKSFRNFLTAKAFRAEIAGNRIENFGRKLITKEIVQFMIEMEPDQQKLLDLVLTAKNLPEERQWQGSNAAAVLLKMNKKALRGQDLSDCRLIQIDFRGCDLTGTKLYRTDLTKCGFDEHIFSAHIIDADFAESVLFLRNMGMKSVSALKKLKNLAGLSISHNQISGVQPLGKLKNLTILHLEHNQISDVQSLGELKNLEYLILEDNQISDVQPLGELKNLKGLGLINSQITDVQPLRELKNLMALRLSNNQISDVHPLGELKNLTSLNLADNQISDVEPLRKLKNLEKLDLSGNNISNVQPLTQLKTLKKLYLKGNPLYKIQVEKLREALPGTHIIF